MAHSPTPWRLIWDELHRTSPGEHTGGDPYMAIQTGEGAIDLIAPPSMAKVHVANSEFILRAVNCHDELVAAAKAVLADSDEGANPYSRLGRSLYEPLKAALAKAEAK